MALNDQPVALRRIGSFCYGLRGVMATDNAELDRRAERVQEVVEVMEGALKLLPGTESSRPTALAVYMIACEVVDDEVAKGWLA